MLLSKALRPPRRPDELARELTVIDVRRIPLFVRIGLMWWVVLLAWPWSRPFLLYANPFLGQGFPDSDYTPPTGLATIGLACLSLLHAVAAGWVVAKVLEVFEPASGFGKTVTRAVFVAWFAVSSWSFLVVAVLSFRRDGPLLQQLGAVAQAGFFSILSFPVFAFTIFWKATSILIPLGFATVLAVRESLRRAEENASSVPGAERTPPLPPTGDAGP